MVGFLKKNQSYSITAITSGFGPGDLGSIPSRTTSNTLS